MPGVITGVDHVGYVVTDLDAALRFFVDVLEFEDIHRRGELFDDDTDRMTRMFGVHARARGRYAFVQSGGTNVELLQWSSPDQANHVPKNSDFGGRHLALSARDLDAVAARLATEPGISVREPNERGFRYVSTPFGLEIQLIPVI